MSVWYTRRTYTHKKLTDFSWFMRAVVGGGPSLRSSDCWSLRWSLSDLTGWSISQACKLANWRPGELTNWRTGKLLNCRSVAALFAYSFWFCFFFLFGTKWIGGWSVCMIAPYDFKYTFKLSQNICSLCTCWRRWTDRCCWLTKHIPVQDPIPSCSLFSLDSSDAYLSASLLASQSLDLGLLSMFSGKPTPTAGSLQIVESWPCANIFGMFILRYISPGIFWLGFCYKIHKEREVLHCAMCVSLVCFVERQRQANNFQWDIDTRHTG